MHRVTVAGIRMIEATNEIVLLLSDGNRQLPLWIGSPEAAAIALAQQGVEPTRPLTHDLILRLVEALGPGLTAVRVASLDDGVFRGELVLADGRAIDCRPSDAVAVALRAGVPIDVAPAVWDEASIPIEHSESDIDVEAFRAFLDDVNPEDFE